MSGQMKDGGLVPDDIVAAADIVNEQLHMGYNKINGEFWRNIEIEPSVQKAAEKLVEFVFDLAGINAQLAAREEGGGA